MVKTAVVLIGLVLLTVGFTAGRAVAQDKTVIVNEGGPEPLSGEMRAMIVDSISSAIDSIYVFPEVARKMTEFIKKQLRKKEYDELEDPMAFTDKLTEDLRSICHDRHLGVRYTSPEEMAMMTEPDPEKMREMELRDARYNNYAFKRLERLQGNIGYLELTGFSGVEGAGRTAIAAMNFLAYCDALIIDLRHNGGGSPAMIQILSSYFFDEPVHLNSFYIRAEDTVRQFWTQAFVDGPRLSDVPIYILTSDYTFSAAEEFTYNLKNLKRATIVGETTGGGAHPVSTFVFDNLPIRVRVPYGRAINPITGTNWEGTGVEPDIKTPAEKAFDTAYLEALKKVSETSSDERSRFELNWIMTGLNAELNPVDMSPEELEKFTGQYGPRKIWLDGDVLKYRRDEGNIYTMKPMGGNLFDVVEIDYFRIEFIPDVNGEIYELKGLYLQGHTDGNKRTR